LPAGLVIIALAQNQRLGLLQILLRQAGNELGVMLAEGGDVEIQDGLGFFVSASRVVSSERIFSLIFWG
jgi:hypothetical protein